MNFPESLTYAPSGRSIVWMVHNLPFWTGSVKREKHPLVKEFSRLILSIILDAYKPLSAADIYRRVPAEHRSPEAYGRLVLQLKRQFDAGRISRTGSTGNYRYAKRGTIPRL